MISQKSAEAFVRTWCHARSVHEVAAKLGKPSTFVGRVAAYLVGIGVRLPHLPVKGAPHDLSLTPEQNGLFVAHTHVVGKLVGSLGKTNVFVRRLGEDAEQVGLMGLARAAQNWRPGRGANFKTFARVVIRNWVLREATRQFGPGGRKSCLDSAYTHLAESRMADPVDEVVRAEEREQVFRVVGPIDLGSTQHKDRYGRANYGDLCRLAQQVGLCPYGLTRDELLATIASVVRARMLRPSPN
jgi:hypothetical protein